MTRHIIIGATVHDARRAAANYRRNGFEVVAIASMRSLDRLRGVVADQAIVCGGTLSEGDSARLREALVPCFATVSEPTVSSTGDES
jgi:hypothetical protein